MGYHRAGFEVVGVDLRPIEFIGTQLLQHLSLNESKEGEANETL